MKKRAAVFLGAFVACWPAIASAEPTNESLAEEKFRAGEKKFDAGQYTEACADFADSLRLGPKLGTLLNIALCHETVGKLATAWLEWRHAAVWAIQNNQKDRRDFANQHIALIEPKLPRVVLQLPQETAFTAIDLDGEPLPEPRWYLPLYLDAGEHALATTAPGKQRGTITFRVTSAPTDQVVLVPVPADLPIAKPEPPPPPPPEPPRPNETKRIAGIAALSAGGVGVLVGASFGVLAITSRNAIGSHCAGQLCDVEGKSHYEDAQGRALVSTIAFGAGILSAAAGVYLLLTATPTATDTPAPPAKSRQARVGVGALPQRGGGSVGIVGAF